MCDYLRFLNDLPYDLLVSPYGFDYRTMTPAQAKKSFEWFMEHVPERLRYMRARCADDLKIEVGKLDYSAESLLLVWQWFLSTARLEKTPKEEIEEMKKGSEIFGESYICRVRLSIASRYMLRDIAIYLGECFIRNSSVLEWSYDTRPKSDVYVNQPLIKGFIVTYQGKNGSARFAPIHMANVQAAKLYDHTQTQNDLFNIFKFWYQRIPDCKKNCETDSRQE